MSTLNEPRYEDGRPMLLGGNRRHHTFAAMATTIAHQWEDFMKLGKLPGQVGTTAYGVICGADLPAQTMEYMCAVEVSDFEALPKGLGRMRVPAARYAVFLHEGNVASIQATWREIFETPACARETRRISRSTTSASMARAVRAA